MSIYFHVHANVYTHIFATDVYIHICVYVYVYKYIHLLEKKKHHKKAFFLEDPIRNSA